MSFLGPRKKEGDRGTKPRSSTGSPIEESASTGGPGGWKVTSRKAYALYSVQQPQQRWILSNVTVRASHSNSGNSMRKSPPATGSRVSKHSTTEHSTGKSKEVETQPQRVVDLNSPKRTEKHVPKDVPGIVFKS